MTRSYRWKLPASLGGRVVPGEPYEWGQDEAVTTVMVEVDGRSFPLPASMLTEVRPPQPSEGWVYVTAADATVPQVFSRQAHWEAGQWWHHDRGDYVTWDRLCELGEPRPLTEAPHRLDRGTCQRCGQIRSLRVDGTVKQHQSATSAGICAGSGEPPKEAL